MTAGKYSIQVKIDMANAAKSLMKDGWAKGSLNYCQPNGPCCAMGHIKRAAGYGRFAINANAFQNEANVPHIPSWNDAPNRTKEEVLEIFLKIANS